MLYINFVCDGEGCKTIQPLNFDKENETFKDLVDAITNAGWLVLKQDNSTTITKTLCNKCNKQV